MRAVQQYPRKDRSHTCMFSGWTYTVLLKILLYQTLYFDKTENVYISSSAR